MRHFAFILSLAVIISTASIVEAGGACGCTAVCPQCNHVCRLTCEKDTEEDKCYIVKSEPICIPKVRMPWDKCCKPVCAKMKYVNVLYRKDFECERCKYRFKPVCTGGCDGHGCAASGCAAGGCDNGCAVGASHHNDVPLPPAVNANQGYGNYYAPPVTTTQKQSVAEEVEGENTLEGLLRAPGRVVNFMTSRSSNEKR